MRYQEENILKILDYNIRCANDGENKMIADRAPRLAALIEKHDPDVIGLQEASRRWINQLDDLLYQKYAMRYTYRSPNSLESTPVLYKRDKFKLLADGHFWLSETPDTPSLGFGATRYPRVCTWVKLKVKATGKVFFFFSTHMNGNVPSTVGGGNVVMERASEMGCFTEYGAFLTGDFNIPPEHEGYNNLHESGRFRDINADLGFDWSYTNNGYNSKEDDDPTNWIKDYIFYTPAKMVPLKYQVLNEEYFGGWISDHRGLYAEVALKD